MSADNKQIKVGDLVQVARWPCCGTWVGYTGKVTALKIDSRCCKICRTDMGEDATYAYVDCGFNGGLVVLGRLKRIPPLSELEGQRTEETLRLPRKEPA